MKQYSSLLFLCTLLLFLSATQAQSPRRAKSSKDWQKLSSQHIEVLFYGKNQPQAQLTARYAERAYFEVAELFDFSPKENYSLFYFPDQTSYSQSNLSLPKAKPISGDFQLPLLEAAIVHPGSQKELYKVIKTAVAKLMATEFSNHRRVGSIIQNKMLFYMPDWYAGGLTDFVGKGWSYQDEMQMNMLELQELNKLAIKGNSSVAKVVRKSIWHYVTQEYGEHKLSEIIYLTNISNSLESGIISVLGITLSTLTNRWRESVKQTASENAQERMSLGEIEGLTEFVPKKKTTLSAYTISPDQKTAALLLHRAGKQELFLYDIATQKYKSTHIVLSHLGDDLATEIAAYPMSWSPSSQQLLTITKHKGEQFFTYYDLQSGAQTLLPVPSKMARILSISYAHKKQLLAISALDGWGSNIYIGAVEGSDFQAITKDPFDNLQPVWSLDDERIFFSSNRDSLYRFIKRKNWESYNRTFDLYQYDRIAKADTLVSITQTPYINEYNPAVINSFELVFLSDASGIPNLSKVNLFLKKRENLSNLRQGILSYQLRENKLYFRTPVKTSKQLFSANSNAIFQDNLLLNPTALRKSLLSKMEEKDKLIRQSIEQTPTIDSTSISPQKEEKIEDEKEGKKQDVRYYIFDDDETPYKVDESKKEPSGSADKIYQSIYSLHAQKKAETPKLSEIKIISAQPLRTDWSADKLMIGFGRRPDAGYFVKLGVQFTDQLKNQSLQLTFTPYIGVFKNFAGKDAQFKLRYEQRKGKWDYQVEAITDSRHYRRLILNSPNSLDSARYRFDHSRVRAGLSYPSSRWSQLNLMAGFHTLNRKDLLLFHDKLNDQSDKLLELKVAYKLDKSKEKEGFVYKGWKLNVSDNSFYSLSHKSIAFHSIKLNARAWKEISGPIVLTAGIHAGASLGQRPQAFYLGGSKNWLSPPIFFENDKDQKSDRNNLMNTHLDQFGMQEFVAPMRAFWHLERNGSKYITSNIELHIPISSLLKHSLNASPLYNMQLVTFLDAGTIWSQGNPFSSKTKNPTDIRVIGFEPVVVELQTLKSPFIYSFGLGFRTRFLGYNVRSDLAWGVDDNSLRAPVLSFSVGKGF